MASCSLGILNMLLKVDCSRTRVCTLQQYRTNRWIVRRPAKNVAFVMSIGSKKPNALPCLPSFGTESTRMSEDCSSDTKSSGMKSNLIPNPKEVEFLLTMLCETSSVAEIDLKLDGFHLHVTRDLTDKIKPPPPPIPASVDLTVKAPDLNGSVSASSLAIKPKNSSGLIQSFIDNAADAGLAIIKSPNVGFFRRSRTIKGKPAPPSCEVNKEVKEGKVVCYIEQFGGHLPVTSNVSGEVVRILREDGEPVGYGDALISILPSFPGIKKLQ